MPSPLVDDMGVANVGFLIENLGKDAGDLQYLRELVQNAFEAIERANRGDDGRVEIDVEDVRGVHKLRITDNGAGMTADEVAENVNMLSASTGVQAFDKNFGIGAKITAAVRNPYGVMYKAWKEGEGSITILGRVEGRYGRLGFRNSEDDRVDYWLPLPEEDKPSIIRTSGVSVVLLGKAEDDDTTAPPPGVDLPSQWVAAYLERRYFQVPKGAVVRVRRPVDIYDSGREQLRAIYDTIRGQRYYLDKHSESGSRLELTDVHAAVWWWLLSDEITSGGKTWNNRGHVAALYQNELYEVRTGGSRASALKDFGIYAGHSRVVIYVQPTNVLGANTSRTALILKGGTAIDYGDIGAAFADSMPDELAAYMAGQVSAEQGDHRKAIRKNLKEVEDALNQARFRRHRGGALASLDVENGGRSPRTYETASSSTGQSTGSRQQDATGRIGSEYLRKAREEMERRLRGQKVDADPLPRIVWDENGSTVPAGRAATYTRTSHVVTANATFDFYIDLLEWGVQEAKSRVASDIDDDTLRQICQDEIRRWLEEALASAVVALRPMAHDARWGPMVYGTGLSDEGLTAAVTSHRWLLMSAIKRGLAGRLGRLKEAAP
jgi:Histidine kinase-, DNA gyrase B-, and HSP90-like ATPase